MLDQITSASTYCYDCEKPLAATNTRAAEEKGSPSINTTVFSARIEVDIVSISAAGAAGAEAASPNQVRSALRELVKGVRQGVRELLRDESLDPETKQDVRKLFRDFRREVQAAFKEFRRTAEEDGAATTLDNAVLEGFYRFKYDVRAALAPQVAPALQDPAASVQGSEPTTPAEVVVPVPQGTGPAQSPAAEEVDPIGEKIYDIVATFERAYYAFKDQLTSFVNSLKPSDPDPGPADPLPNDTPATSLDPSTEPSAGETTSTVFAYTRTSISIEFGSSSFTLAA